MLVWIKSFVSLAMGLARRHALLYMWASRRLHLNSRPGLSPVLAMAQICTCLLNNHKWQLFGSVSLRCRDINGTSHRAAVPCASALLWMRRTSVDLLLLSCCLVICDMHVTGANATHRLHGIVIVVCMQYMKMWAVFLFRTSIIIQFYSASSFTILSGLRMKFNAWQNH